MTKATDDDGRRGKKKGLAQGRARRAMKVGGLATSVGTGYLREALLSPFRHPSKREEAMLDTHIETAMKIVESSQELRGAFTKLVQLLSMRDDILPAQMLDVLSSVQSSVPPMDYPLIREQVRRELGAPPEEIFAEFDEDAFAAASLGQVHRAVTKDGVEVVVKVQYPGVETSVRQDLQNIKALLKTLTMVGRDVLRQKIDSSEVYNELEERLHEELDYENEARNIVLFRRMFADDDEVLIPAVYPELSSRRVLTMEKIEGYALADILAPGVEQSLKDWVAVKYFRILWRQLFEYGVLHADPNPGNYLVTFHPKLGVLDFGSIRRFSPPLRKAYLGFARAILAWDEDELAESYLRLGYLNPGDDPAPMHEIVAIVFEPLRVDGDYDPRSYDAVDRGIRVARIAIEHRIFNDPNHRVMLVRALMGLDAYMKQLGTITNWRAEFQRCVDSVREGAAEELLRD
jgi:predicted unusual protein kinase regulating ubiquinone biosynthesis (AarF/ABC1/UbiB family)